MLWRHLPFILMGRRDDDCATTTTMAQKCMVRVQPVSQSYCTVYYMHKYLLFVLFFLSSLNSHSRIVVALLVASFFFFCFSVLGERQDGAECCRCHTARPCQWHRVRLHCIARVCLAPVRSPDKVHHYEMCVPCCAVCCVLCIAVVVAAAADPLRNGNQLFLRWRQLYLRFFAFDFVCRFNSLSLCPTLATFRLSSSVSLFLFGLQLIL